MVIIYLKARYYKSLVDILRFWPVKCQINEKYFRQGYLFYFIF